jgi:hypothetical protein
MPTVSYFARRPPFPLVAPLASIPTLSFMKLYEGARFWSPIARVTITRVRVYVSSPTSCLINKICVRILAKTGNLSTIYKQQAFPGAMLCEMACKCYVFGVVWRERSETKNELLRKATRRLSQLAYTPPVANMKFSNTV